MKKENINIDNLSLKECLNRLINEDKERVVMYYNKLGNAVHELSTVAFDCPVISQDIRQEIMSVKMEIEDIMYKMVKQGYVSELDGDDKVEYRSDVELDESFPTYTQIRNVTGIEDDDELNAGVEAERREDLESNIVTDLGRYEGKMLNFDDVCKLLKDRYGFEYLRSDDERECHEFSNGDDVLNLFPKIYYPKQGTMRLHNLYISSK